jgi:hypothetical protein
LCEPPLCINQQNSFRPARACMNQADAIFKLALLTARKKTVIFPHGQSSKGFDQ